MLNCFCGAQRSPLPPLPAKHDKTYLRKHYPKRAVDVSMYLCDKNGKKKGRYTIGHGKHGKVKAAYSVQHGCKVAIKSQNKRQLLVAKGEVALARQLQLKHVIRVFDWAEGPKKSYIVMEEGQPLSTQGATPQSARALLWDIIEGLRELHAHDVYHRDIGVYEQADGAIIKNIMVADGICKMTDIGKMACSPPAALRGVYARADARGLSRVMHAFLKVCDPEEAEPFYRWYTAQPNLSVEDVAAHPWLFEQPRPKNPGRGHALFYPMHVFTEWVTSPAPLLTGRGQPRVPPSTLQALQSPHQACASNKRL